MIDHGTWIPFRTNEWEVGETTIPSPIQPFTFAYTMVNTITQLVRRSDHATATVELPVMLSAPWLGGPTRGPTLRLGQSGRGWEQYYYEDGADITIRHDKHDGFGGKTLTEPLRTSADAVHVPRGVVDAALARAGQRVKHLFDTDEVVYMEASGPCQFVLDDEMTIVVIIPTQTTAH